MANVKPEQNAEKSAPDLVFKNIVEAPPESYGTGFVFGGQTDAASMAPKRPVPDPKSTSR